VRSAKLQKPNIHRFFLIVESRPKMMRLIILAHDAKGGLSGGISKIREEKKKGHWVVKRTEAHCIYVCAYVCLNTA
jgi:hypothetical protein